MSEGGARSPLAALHDHALRRSDHCAVEAPTGSLTYRELESRSTQLARYLRRQGVSRGDLVAIVGSREVTTVVGILGIVKAGAAFLPIDPDQPGGRRGQMLDQAKPHHLVHERGGDWVEAFAGNSICLAADWPAISTSSVEPVGEHPASRDLAYVLYTSGSTGAPKGVMIEWRGLADMARAHVRAFGIDQASRVLQFASFGFDAAVSELFTTLCGGGTLCMTPDRLQGSDLLAVLDTRRITNVLLPPTVLAELPPHPLPHLKTIIAGGEPCPQALVQRWGRCRDFFNAYGPTEGTVTATLHCCDVADEHDPPIGGPRDGVRVHVLDTAQEPVAEGEVGELYIGGAGVARGYLGRADWTASRFLPEPGTVDGDRMYRTGDLVSRQETGRLEFVGRSDRQVKIRGTRVELGEVEAVLISHPALLQVAAVVYDDRGDRRIVAYYREAVEGTTTSRDLRSWLGQRLPPQMLPSRFVPVAELPLAPSGKVDYSALSESGVLAPSDSDAGETDQLSSPSVRPRMTAREAQLHSLWCAVIGLPPDELSIDDHFVEVGGDSVLSVRIADALETQGLPVRAQDLLDHGSIRRLAKAIDSRAEPR